MVRSGSARQGILFTNHIQGLAGFSEARLGNVRSGAAGPGRARQGHFTLKVGYGDAGWVEVRHGEARNHNSEITFEVWLGGVGLGVARFGRVWSGKVWRGDARQGKEGELIWQDR